MQLINWKQVLVEHPEYRDIENIDPPLLSEVSKTKRRTFSKYCRIYSSAAQGVKSKDVAKKFGVTPARVSQIMTRVLGHHEGETPALGKALIPGEHINRNCRIKSLSSLSEPAGCRGAFTALISSVPGLLEHMDKMILEDLKRSPHSQNLTPASFQSMSIAFLIDNGWKMTVYPLDQPTRAYESFRQYFHSRKQELQLATSNTSPRPILSKIVPLKPYQEIEIDSQVFDVNTSIEINIGRICERVRLSRVTLFLVIDVATGCILSYQLCITRDPTQEDLLSLLEKIHRPWEPLELKTPLLSYDPGACLPSKLSELNEHAGIGVIKMDNALCHMSLLARHYICESLMASLNFGLPAAPKTRNFIEYAFRMLNHHSHRFDSTTGSHPKDPIKESSVNSKKPPVLTLSALNEVLSVVITNYNIKPQERLHARSPIDMMKALMTTKFPRISFSHLDGPSNPFARRIERQVKRIAHENRRPHLNFEGFRYTGECLSVPQLVGKSVIIEYDIRDIRQVKVYLPNGNNIGVVNAPRSWQSYPLSLQTKKKIRKETRIARLNTRDPLVGYFTYLLENKSIPKQATELSRVYQEIVENQDGHIVPIDTSTIDKLTKSSSLVKTIPRWSRKLFKPKSK